MRLRTVFIQGILLFLILIGVYFRFNWVNWSQGANLHPDEYGLTNTLTALRLPDSLADYFNTRLSPLSAYPRYDLAGNKTADGPDNAMLWGQWPQIILRCLAEWTGNTGYDQLRLMGRTLSALVDTLTLLFIFLIGARLYSRTVGLAAVALSSLAVLQIQSSHFMTVDNYAALFATIAIYVGVRIAQRPSARRICVPPSTATLPGSPEGVDPVVAPVPPRGVIVAPHPSTPIAPYRPDPQAFGWYALFGVAYGMALASKINLLPLGGLVVVAAFLSIADVKIKSTKEPGRIFLIAAMGLVVAILMTGITFRLTQPMSFRAATGDTTLFTLSPNLDWLRNVASAARQSSGEGGGPPAEQWAHRPIVLFPLSNMLLWGLGLPLGVMAWVGFFWAAWRSMRYRDGWRLHLLPLIWTGGYFIYMATRWVKSIRYFLPIYPFLALFAAWGVVELWRVVKQKNEGKEQTRIPGQTRRGRPMCLPPPGRIHKPWQTRTPGQTRRGRPMCLPPPGQTHKPWQTRTPGQTRRGRPMCLPPPGQTRRSAPTRLIWYLRWGLVGLVTVVVFGGTLVWANTFVSAIYRTDHTRVQATRWMLQNIPAPFHLLLTGSAGTFAAPVAAPDQLSIGATIPFVQAFDARQTGQLARVILPHVRSSNQVNRLQIVIAADPNGQTLLDQVEISLPATTSQGPGAMVSGAFQGATLMAGQTYYLIARTRDAPSITLERSVISNESWDEGLPFSFDGYNPFGDFYQGVTMEARWYDGPEKRQMYLDVLAQADFVLLQSQRAIWSACRIPRTYPMTMEYYRAMFDGRLGFDLAAIFQAPLRLGPLYISDVGGSLVWNQMPELPLFNNNLLAVEEAFSVYDHPPVWIFRKRADFSLEQARAVLSAVDLSQVAVESPFKASGTPCK